MEPENVIASWISDLGSCRDGEELNAVLKDIFIKIHPTTVAVVEPLLSKLIDRSNVTDDKLNLENNFKTYFRIYFKLRQQIDVINDFESRSIATQVALISGIFASEYYKILDAGNLFKICFVSIKVACTKGYTKYSVGAIKNLISFCKFFPEYPIPSKDIWNLIYLSLDLPFHGIREQCMILLDFIISQDENFTLQLFDEIINFWSWTNRFKYYILSVIFTNYGFYRILERHQNLDINFFLMGMTLSLKYRQLLSASQSLVRTIVGQNVVEFNAIVCQILRTGTDFEFQNCLNQWMIYFIKSINFEIYEELFESTSNFLENYFIETDNLDRFVCLRNIFGVAFYKRHDIDEIDAYLFLNFERLKAAYTKGHIFEIFLARLLKGSMENLREIKMFIINCAITDCPALRHTVLKKISIIYDFLAKSYFNKKLTCRDEIFHFFRFLKCDIYDTGVVQLDNYQSLIFSLKLCHNMWASCVRSRNNSKLNKSSNIEINRQFRDVLAQENIWNFKDTAEYMKILHLIENEFDDIREMATNVLINLEIKMEDSQYTDKCLALISSTDTNKCGYGPLYCQLFVNAQTLDKCDKFLSTLHTKLLYTFERVKLDTCQAVMEGYHLFGILNAISEFYRANKLSWGEPLAYNFTTLIEDISNFMLSILNLAGKNEFEAPDFETMDESLQILINKSVLNCNLTQHTEYRKQLILSIWLTLKSCGDIATQIGIYFLKHGDESDNHFDTIRQCLNINYSNLYKCRHKGVIEAAGLSLGELVNYITTNYRQSSQFYGLLYEAFPILMGNKEIISTTRRGAGFSIMLHHLIKNDVQTDRPLLKHALKQLLNPNNLSTNGYSRDNCDSLEAAILHYLCVLVNDSVLREDIMPYMEQIMEIAFRQINSNEWKIRNAALQLFGAVIPKLLGQKQFYEAETNDWDPVEATLDEITIKMPKLNVYILQHLDGTKNTASIILFLEFLSKIEVRKLSFNDTDNIFQYNQIFWTLLRHPSEKVRVLAAKCFTLFHEFRLGIPKAIENVIEIVFKIRTDENFVHGLIRVLICMLKKYECDIRFIQLDGRAFLFNKIRELICHNYQLRTGEFKSQSYYLRCNFLEFFNYLEFDLWNEIVLDVIFLKRNIRPVDIDEITQKSADVNQEIGFDLWSNAVRSLYLPIIN